MEAALNKASPKKAAAPLTGTVSASVAQQALKAIVPQEAPKIDPQAIAQVLPKDQDPTGGFIGKYSKKMNAINQVKKDAIKNQE